MKLDPYHFEDDLLKLLVDTIARIRTRLYGLFAETDPWKRGKALEKVLNDYFAWAEISICEEFTLRMEYGKPLEQVDGVIEIDGTLYLVEVKWWKEPIGVPEVSQHISRIFLRGGQVRGIFVSYSPFADTAIRTCEQAYPTGAVVTLCLLQEIITLMDKEGDLRAMLKAKINASLLYKKPLSVAAI